MAALPPNIKYIIVDDPVTWLEENLVGKGWDINRFADPDTLVQISIARRIIIYFLYIFVDLNMCGVKLFKHISSLDIKLYWTENTTSLVRASFQERAAEAAYSNLEVENNAFEYEHSYKLATRLVLVLRCMERRWRKELEQSAKKFRHDPQVVLALDSPNATFATSTPSHQHPQ